MQPLRACVKIRCVAAHADGENLRWTCGEREREKKKHSEIQKVE